MKKTPGPLVSVVMGSDSDLPIMKEAGEQLKLFGIPFSWKARINAWSPPDLFVDEQLEGPYRQWVHRHTFRDGPQGGTIVEDEVRFRLPAAPLGEAAYPMVRKQLERIFSYRQEAVRSILGA